MAKKAKSSWDLGERMVCYGSLDYPHDEVRWNGDHACWMCEGRGQQLDAILTIESIKITAA